MKLTKALQRLLNNALDMPGGTYFTRYMQGESLTDLDEFKALRFKRQHYKLTPTEENRYWEIQELYNYEI